MIKVKLVPFNLTWEWLPAEEGVLGVLDRATWGRLRITVGSDCATQLATTSTGEYRDYFEGPLYALAEWMAFNWWSLTVDARPGTMISQLRFAYKGGVGDQRGSWIRRPRTHTLRAASAGYHWPDMMFVPEGRQTRVVWMPDSAPAGREHASYLGSGNAVLDTEQFQATVAGFVSAAVNRLEEQGMTHSDLQQEWHAIGETAEDEAEYCRRAAQLGLDPYDAADSYGDEIAQVAAALPEQMVFDFFNGVGRNRLSDRLVWVKRARTSAGASTNQVIPDSIMQLRAVCADLREMFYAPGAREDAWDIGAETARRVRAWAGVADTEPFEPEAFMNWQVAETDYLDRGLVALGSLAGTLGPTIVAARNFDDRPRRFLQCRALWHFVAGAEDEFLIVAAHTHRQHVARGFALEALAPATGVARLLGDPAHLVTAEDVEQIADRYLCGNIVVEHQLDNRVTAPDFQWQPDPTIIAETSLRTVAEQV